MGLGPGCGGVGVCALPVGATGKDIDATYKAGILEVGVPVDKQKAAATKIPVRTT